MSDAIRDFVVATEKALSSRRLYAPRSEPYRDVLRKLYDKCRAAVGDEGFTLRVGHTDLFVGTKSVIHRPSREGSFFFPLYRDGMRELSFGPGVTAEEVDALLRVLEAEDRRATGSADDTVNLLWRSGCDGLSYRAVDGLGDAEDENPPDASRDDFGALVADLVGKITNPAPPELGQSYAFVMDADVRVAASDFTYEATTVRRRFEENPLVYALSRGDAAHAQAEMGPGRDAALVGRFVDVLLEMLRHPASPIPVGTATEVLAKLLDSYWTSGDDASVESLMGRLRSVADLGAMPDARAAAAGLLSAFLTRARLQEVFERVQAGSLPPASLLRVLELAGEAGFAAGVDMAARAGEGPTREHVMAQLERQAAANPDVLRPSLSALEPKQLRIALSLLGRGQEAAFAAEILAIAAHPDESIRLKGLGVAARLGGHRAFDVLWQAMESDPSTAARLFAFRTMAAWNPPGLDRRLQRLVSDPGFPSRPVWDRVKYVRLLGSVGGPAVAELFESWLPTARWFWSDTDRETAAVALRGLLACGGHAAGKVRALALSNGRLGKVARAVSESSAGESGETTALNPAVSGAR